MECVRAIAACALDGDICDMKRRIAAQQDVIAEYRKELQRVGRRGREDALRCAFLTLVARSSASGRVVAALWRAYSAKRAQCACLGAEVAEYRSVHEQICAAVEANRALLPDVAAACHGVRQMARHAGTVAARNDAHEAGKTCVVCWERERTVRFSGCGHFCCCLECCYSLNDTCPMCRGAIGECQGVYAS